MGYWGSDLTCIIGIWYLESDFESMSSEKAIFKKFNLGSSSTQTTSYSIEQLRLHVVQRGSSEPSFKANWLAHVPYRTV